MKCVFCEIGTEFLNIIKMKFRLDRVKYSSVFTPEFIVRRTTAFLKDPAQYAFLFEEWSLISCFEEYAISLSF
jgi:hypothetical protein